MHDAFHQKTNSLQKHFAILSSRPTALKWSFLDLQGKQLERHTFIISREDWQKGAKPIEMLGGLTHLQEWSTMRLPEKCLPFHGQRRTRSQLLTEERKTEQSNNSYAKGRRPAWTPSLQPCDGRRV